MDPRRHGATMAQGPRDPRWYETTEFSTLVFFLISDFLHKVSNPTKTSEKNHFSYSTVSLKKPHSFYKSQLISTLKIYAPALQP